MRFVSIVAARPNFVKLAAIVHALPEDWTHTIIHTGQHYDPLLSDVFFNDLQIPDPKNNLGVKGGAANEETVENTRKACVPILQKYKPDLIIVYGDVAGALGGARAAHELDIPIAHVEAGLRSFDETMPEERNRIAIDTIASFLFVTEQSGVANLKKEGITKGVHLVGNTMIDTLLRMRDSINKQELPANLPEHFGVVTLHRPGNVDHGTNLRKNVEFVNDISKKCHIVFPIHPRTKARMRGRRIDFGYQSRIGFTSSVMAVEPLPYLSFLKLLSKSNFILTDSGGIQEEATFLGKKCFTLRKNTERPSTIESGSNTLIDLEKAEDRTLVLDYAARRDSPAIIIPPLWDGQAGIRIVGILRQHLHAR